MSVYQNAKRFKKKFPLTIAWRLKSNANILESHLNPDEEIIYVFTGQKSPEIGYDSQTRIDFLMTSSSFDLEHYIAR